MKPTSQDIHDLFGSTLAEGLQISETPIPAPDANHIKGLAAVDLDAPATRTQSAHGRKVENVLLLYRSWLLRDQSIQIEQVDQGIQIQHAHAYLTLAGLEDAIIDWYDGGFIIDPERVTNTRFGFVHEDGGCMISLQDGANMYAIQKAENGEWPSVDATLATLGDDAPLRTHLRAMQEIDTPWTRATIVALAHRHAQTAALEDRVTALRTGAMSPPQRTALDWLQSLNGAQLRELQNLANARLQLMHDKMNDVQSVAIHTGEANDALIHLAQDRESIEALLVLFRDLGISNAFLLGLVEPLDARGEEVITMAPDLHVPEDDIVLQRSQELAPGAWWTRRLD